MFTTIYCCIITKLFKKIKELRKSLDLTQKEVSKLVSIPLRTYLNYENDETKKGTIK